MIGNVSMYAIFLDIETTGLDPYQHRPIDLAFQVFDFKKDKVIASYQEKIYISKEDWDQHDPNSIKVNGYCYADLEDGKTSKVISKEVIDLLTEIGIKRGRAFFLCQNPAFDRAFFDHIVPVYTQESLDWPYHWLDLASMYWAVVVRKNKRLGVALPEQMTLSKNAIGKQFGIPEEKEPHRAMNGVEHLMLCYRTVISFVSE